MPLAESYMMKWTSDSLPSCCLSPQQENSARMRSVGSKIEILFLFAYV